MIIHERITCQLKFLEKMSEKNLFLQFFLTNLQEKISYNMRIFNSVSFKKLKIIKKFKSFIL